MTITSAVLGWDIGGVNTKVARLVHGGAPSNVRSACLPFEVKRDPSALIVLLTRAAQSVGADSSDLHAVTMTAELSQAFRTKREGVDFILGALETAFPGCQFHVYGVDGLFVPPHEARERPLVVSAANWFATALLTAVSEPTCLLLDIGTTTADLTPIVGGKVVAKGWTDPERLLSGELVYTGALRTPVEAVAQHVPLWGGRASVAADGFALIGDAHLWLNRLVPEDYTCPTPDGQPPSRQSAADRLARSVCGDRDMVNDAAVTTIAESLAMAQVQTLCRALERILNRQPSIRCAVVSGMGDFIAAEAAETMGLEIIHLSDRLGESARVAPAVAVAWLLRHSMEPAE